MGENRSAEGDRPTVEQPAPVREAPTSTGPAEPAGGWATAPSVPPPLPPPVLAPGVPPPLPPVPMEPAVGLAPRTVVLVAVVAALVGAGLTALLFVALG